MAQSLARQLLRIRTESDRLKGLRAIDDLQVLNLGFMVRGERETTGYEPVDQGLVTCCLSLARDEPQVVTKPYLCLSQVGGLF